MSHVLKYADWESGSGKWYCNDTSDLAGVAGKWWVPARMLNLAPAAYIKWLIDNYHPDHISWNGETLLYSWDNYSPCHSFVLFINREARKRNFIV